MMDNQISACIRHICLYILDFSEMAPAPLGNIHNVLLCIRVYI